MKKIETYRRWIFTGGTVFILGCMVYLCLLNKPAKAAALYIQTEPSPTVDRLAIPVLPDHPTQVEIGKNVYYYHCMPCHGDKGQRLTSEWRSQWVDDHQNCWGRGCHGSL
jgi:cytochrome c